MLDDKKVDRHIRIDIPRWRKGATGFTANLFTLIQSADPMNQHKLSTLFPNQVKAYQQWDKQRWEDFRGMETDNQK